MELMRHDPRNSAAIVLGERIDIYVVAELHQQLSRALERGDAAVVLDLSRAEFVDTAGVQLLVACIKEAEQKNIELCMQGVSSAVMETARRLGLHEVLLPSG